MYNQIPNQNPIQGAFWGTIGKPCRVRRSQPKHPTSRAAPLLWYLDFMATGAPGVRLFPWEVDKVHGDERVGEPDPFRDGGIADRQLPQGVLEMVLVFVLHCVLVRLHLCVLVCGIWWFRERLGSSQCKSVSCRQTDHLTTFRISNNIEHGGKWWVLNII